MSDAALLLVPVAGLAVLVLAGAGLVSVLAPTLPPDARTALAPLGAAGVLAAGSVLLPLGVPARVLGVLLLGGLVALTGAAIRRAAATLRRGALPVALAVGAIALAAAPSVARGDWRATSLYGSTDAYHWISQGRAYLEGPAPPPVAEHPDRLTYERARGQHWAPALPFAVGQLAWLRGVDAVDGYGALAALLAALLPLATYAAARACLEWTPPVAAAAGAAVALNASLLFASHFSWQQQVAGTALAFAAAALLRLGLEPGTPRGVLLLASVLAAGALGTYRLGFAPFLGALVATVVLAHALHAGARTRRLALRRTAVFTAATATLAAPSLVALARGLPGFVDSGGFSTAFKEHFVRGQPAEALGLVPHVWAVEEGWPGSLRIAWLVAGSLVAAVMLVAGARRARGRPRADFLGAGAVLVLGGYLVLLVPAFAPYLSYKLLSYGVPFLVLLALGPVAARPAGFPLAAAGSAVLLVTASALAATVAAERRARPAPVVVAGAGVPADAVVRISTGDPWEQAWQLYALRDVRVSVEQPTYILTAQGPERDASAYRRRHVSHEAVRTRTGEVAVVPLARAG